MNSRLVFLIAAVIAAWVMAANSGSSLAYGLAYLSSGVLAFSWLWAWNGIRRVQVRRTTRSRRSQVGQFAEEQFELVNRSGWPKLWLEVLDESTLPWHAVGRVVSTLGRKATHRWQVRTLCTQRGRFRLGPMQIATSDPLGVFRQRRTLPATSYIVVYPLTVELPSFEPSISDLAGGEARHRRTYQVTTNASGVRDYAPGDSLNRIHWPTTARTRRLMTKEFELDPTSDVWIYLDLYRPVEGKLPWSPQAPEPGVFAMHTVQRQRSQFELPPSTTEYSVAATASLARYFLLRGRAVGMSSNGHSREFLQADRGERQLNKILESLAVVEAQGDMPFSQLISMDGVRLNRNDTVIAVSPDWSPEWAAALKLLQRRGVNSIAIVIDGSSFGRPVAYDQVLAEFEGAGIPSYILRKGEPLDLALRTPRRGMEALR